MFYVILCEGKTDSVIINHIMTSIGFIFIKNFQELGLNFKFKELKRQNIDYFKKEEDILAIWNTAGYSNIKSSVEQITRLIENGERIDRLSIITDRDKSEISEIENKIASYFVGNFILKNNEWKDYQIKDSFGRTIELKVLLQIVPTEKWGALETLLINALSEKGDEEKKLVERVEEFIEKLKIEKSTFLEKERNVIKSKLGCTVNIMDPERTFKDIIPVLNSIDWSKNNTVQEYFDKIKNYK